jgi:hypothetical protein
MHEGDSVTTIAGSAPLGTFTRCKRPSSSTTAIRAPMLVTETRTKCIGVLLFGKAGHVKLAGGVDAVSKTLQPVRLAGLHAFTHDSWRVDFAPC